MAVASYWKISNAVPVNSSTYALGEPKIKDMEYGLRIYAVGVPFSMIV